MINKIIIGQINHLKMTRIEKNMNKSYKMSIAFKKYLILKMMRNKKIWIHKTRKIIQISSASIQKALHLVSKNR